jgi:sporulation protein YlmC with PRC-barrel domain
MSKFMRGLMAASAASALLVFNLPASAQDAAAPAVTPAPAANADVSTSMGISAVDAGKLIGKNVVDAKGDTVGEVDSVIVDTGGKVNSVVLDVGGWLSGKKLISVPWSDLKSTADGKITTSLTKEAAEAAGDYKYKDPSLSGKVLGESGTAYDTNTTANSSTSTSTAMGTSVRNADGSLNASEVIGLDVRNVNHDSIGEISQLVIDKNGKVSGVVVDVGGFLGIGTHPVLLQWKQVKLTDQDGKTEAVVNIGKDTLKAMPAYKS